MTAIPGPSVLAPLAVVRARRRRRRQWQGLVALFELAVALLFVAWVFRRAVWP